MNHNNGIKNHTESSQTPKVLFEVRETNSAFGGFAREFTTDGVERYDAESFLYEAREHITNVLYNNRGTKVKLIFKCYMEKIRPNVVPVIRPFYFHSDIMINLGGMDEIEIYKNMIKTMIERIATLQTCESGWWFHSVIKLELHTIDYKNQLGK